MYESQTAALKPRSNRRRNLIILAVALNKCTEYYTGTEYEPVKSLAKNCQTGHATNIIAGVEPIFQSAPPRRGRSPGGDWNLDTALPAQ